MKPLSFLKAFLTNFVLISQIWREMMGGCASLRGEDAYIDAPF